MVKENKQWDVKFNTTNTDRNSYTRRGKEVYRHPRNYYVILEFDGRDGRFRESYEPKELIPISK